MVDREARDKFAELVRHLANGRISEKHFDETLESLPSTGKDPVFGAIIEELYTIEFAPLPDVARWILFLQTDMEYEWPGLDQLPNPLEVIVAVTLCLMLGGIFHNVSIAWWATVAGMALSQIIARCVGSKHRTPGDLVAWPFHKQSDFEEARRHPRLLNGGRR
jgi:hypothetical protein